jgi:hypothetical protein
MPEADRRNSHFDTAPASTFVRTGTMKQQYKNSLLALAIVVGLLSLPMTWMTIRGAQIQGGFGEMFNSVFGNMTFDVTGLSGHVTFLVETPIWFIILVTIAASVVQLMRGSKTFAIPSVVEWGLACVAVAWVGLALVLALFSDQVSLGMGALLGLFAAATPFVMLCLPTAAADDRSANPQ